MTYMLVFSWIVVWLVAVALYSVFRSTQLIERDAAKEYWFQQPVLTQVRYEKYNPIQLHASVIVTDSVLCQFRGAAEDHMRYSVEQAARKVLDGARQYVRIETNKDFGSYGTEIRASLDVYQRSGS